jgi:hypothetical protein
MGFNMARTAQDTDFVVKVEGVGSFTFGKRTMRDEIAIQVEFARIIDGVEPTAWLQTVGGWMSTLRVLTVRAPAGFDLDDLDPLDDESYALMGKVHNALAEQERSFRRSKNGGSKGNSPASGDDGGVLVP